MRRIVTAIGLCICALSQPGVARGDYIVTIDSTVYGYATFDPGPFVGQQIQPINAKGGPLNQLTLPAGTYQITNAYGLSGVSSFFSGWRFNGNPNWVWSVIIADNATDTIVFYGAVGNAQTTQAGIAALPEVQNFQGTLTLPATTTLDFLIGDYYLPDNAGGVAIDIHTGGAAVPEPSSLGLLGACALGFLAYRWRRRRIGPGVEGPR